jgi:hypothetical protein
MPGTSVALLRSVVFLGDTLTRAMDMSLKHSSYHRDKQNYFGTIMWNDFVEFPKCQILVNPTAYCDAWGVGVNEQNVHH